MNQTETIEDVTEYYADRFKTIPALKVVNAERKGANVLVLVDHGDQGALLAGDKKPRRWEIIYYWLSNPQAELCQVLGDEITWYETKEVNPKLGLFEQFNCF